MGVRSCPVEEETVIWMSADFHSLFGTCDGFCAAGGGGGLCFHISSEGLTDCSISKLSSVLGKHACLVLAGETGSGTTETPSLQSSCLAAFSHHPRRAPRSQRWCPLPRSPDPSWGTAAQPTPCRQKWHRQLLGTGCRIRSVLIQQLCLAACFREQAWQAGRCLG